MSKVLVFCIDALCPGDIGEMRNMPNFGPLIARSSYVKKIEPVWPALTYCCHTSIITGCYVDRHGIYHNEKIKRGGFFNEPWFNQKKEIKVPTLLDKAKEVGLTTCSLSWPVSGGANYDFNMPMIVPYHYTGWEPEKWLEGAATKNLMERYFHKHGRYIKGPDRSLDLFTMALALDIIEDFDQPDIMFVKMCDLDSTRHSNGVQHQKVTDQLRKHDEELGSLLEVIKRNGSFDQTNVVILGDHGMTDVNDVFLINVMLREAGFIKIDRNGKLLDYKALCHSNGLSAYIEVRDPTDHGLINEVRSFLQDLMDDPQIMLDYVMDINQAREFFKVDGPFDFIIESKLPISFGEQLDGNSIWGSKIAGDHKIGVATHGGSPNRSEVTSFVAYGPDIKEGVVIEQRPMIDEAPTIARMLGFEMFDTDGSVIAELLR
mgnify:FL=1